MKALNKVIGINLGLLLAYSIVIRIIAKSGDTGVPYHHASGDILGMSFFIILIHVIALFLTSVVLYIAGKVQLANSFLLTTFLTLLVGFGVCLGNSSI
jgi:hypothetical protein